MRQTSFLALLPIVLLAACSPTIANLASENRIHFNRLAVGMGKTDALQVMGSEQGSEPVTVRRVGFFSNERIAQPYRVDSIRTDDGAVLEVLYYITDVRGLEFDVSDDELTPLVVKDGRLVGWGRTFFDQNVQRTELRVR